MYHIRWLIVALLLGIPAQSEAQEISPLALGARIRISVWIGGPTRLGGTRTVSARRLVGTLKSLKADTLELNVSERIDPRDTTLRSFQWDVQGKGSLVAVPLASVAKVELSLGHRSRVKNVLKSAGIGLAILAGTGVAILLVTPADNVVGPSILLGFTGALWGTIFGAIRDTEKWETVSIDHVQAM